MYSTFNSSQTQKAKSSSHNFYLWLLIAIFFVISITLNAVGAGKIVRFFFPVSGSLLALFLYIRNPMMYIGFTWWIWMITPLMARLVDYRTGWDPQRMMMITTYLVTFIPLITMTKSLPQLILQGASPFAVSLLAILYGVAIGLLHASTYSVVRSLIDWLSPIIFGLYFFSKWRSYPDIRDNLQSVFLWGVGITGAYGVYQYITAPEWDKFWLIESGMFTSAGNPAPFEIRVWSTMNSPGPFSSFITAGLLLLFSSNSRLAPISNLFGYTSFLLSLVRTAWGSWFVGLVFLFISLNSKGQFGILSKILLVLIAVVPVIIYSPFSESILSRMQTLTNLSDDGSFNARQGIYEHALNDALSNFIGNGFGGVWNSQDGALKQVVIDSGIIDVLTTLGWVGATFYFGGLFVAFIQIFNSRAAKFDPFLNVSRAISFSFLLQMIMGTAVLGFTGILVWSFLGISLAGEKYHNFVQEHNVQGDLD